MKPGAGSLKKINKIDKSLVRLIKIKSEKEDSKRMRIKRGGITTDTTEI